VLKRYIMKPDPNYEDYVQRWSELYESNNYDQGLAGYFLSKSHEWSEQPFGPDKHFAKVLEVGAGSGVHIRYVRHSFEEYWITDLNPPMLDTFKLPLSVKVHGQLFRQQENATALSFSDGTFDRVIAAHVLEHLYKPHEVLREWTRVLKPGGVLTLLLPCDPGVAWRLGRYTSARKKFINAGIEYDYWMAREHVNPINCLVSFVRHYFTDITEEWRPLMFPSIDLNLFYIAHVRT
jgi:phosphatidylethanolamine/phosphatidyl-N-methylethanolamine N-methyltransferase